VLTRIKTDQHLRGIPVIILTTSSTDTDILRAYQLGANCHVSKPVGLDDFLRAIHGIENLWLNPVRYTGLFPPRNPVRFSTEIPAAPGRSTERALVRWICWPTGIPGVSAPVVCVGGI